MVTAAQTVKALEEERPAAGGTKDSIKIFIPLGLLILFLRGDSRAKIAL